MLIYHPAYDAHHCTIRMLALLTKMPSFEIEKARILDFYLAFPGAAVTFRLPMEIKQVRRIFQSMKNIYRDPVSAKRTFTEIRQVQLAALSCLAAAGMINEKKLQKGIVERTDTPLPNTFKNAVNSFINQEEQLLNALVENIANIPTAGPHGLKDRSELLEYRYDAT